jgi:predicted nucleic acid-binding protein
VIDASAGVELVVDTTRGKALRQLIPPRAALAAPEHFAAEVAGVLRRWELTGVLAPRDAAASLDRLIHWPLRRVTLIPLLQDAWSYRPNFTIADALYVVLAERLRASLLTDDHKLVNSPTFPAGVSCLTIP